MYDEWDRDDWSKQALADQLHNVPNEHVLDLRTEDGEPLRIAGIFSGPDGASVQIIITRT
ncbi:hypothetical protein [Nonomuraea salmonea]|uniref:hypothetical protein n=1 Tax=Nonomuraea salmonea TaxID=46181 RepID=UPI002FEDA9C3